MKLEDQIISNFLKSIGPWRDYIVIGGGFAPIVYKLYCSKDDLKKMPVATTDIDSLIPRNVPKISSKSLSDYLKDSGFLQSYKDYQDPATEIYTKEINGVDIDIEFLTDNNSRKDKHKNVKISGIVAQPLSYLSLSLKFTMNFITHSGEKGFVVSPSAWVFHKGLTFTKRSNKAKIYKDLYGIWYVLSELGTLSEVCLNELFELFKMHSSWHETFNKNLIEWLENASLDDWNHLEAQDPNADLKKIKFQYLIRKILKS